MDYETALKIELHFARRQEKAFGDTHDAVNAERWHMAAEAFQRSLDLYEHHKQEFQPADKHSGGA